MKCRLLCLFLLISCLYSLPAQEATLVLPVGHSGMVTSASFSPEGDHVVTASDDGIIRIFDAESGKELSSLFGHRSIVWMTLFSPDGNRILSAGVDRTARLFSVLTGEELYKIQDHTDEVTIAQFSPDGLSFLTAGKDNTCKVYETESGKLLQTLAAHTEYITSAMFSPPTQRDPNGGSHILTSSEDGTAIVYAISTGELVKTLKGHTLGLRSAEYSPDGKLILTSSKDKTARIFSAKTGELLHTLADHTEWLNYAGFSRDGTKIITTSDDNAARVYKTSSGELLHTLEGHRAEIFYGQFSPDDKHIATASADHSMRIFDVATGQSILSIDKHSEMVFAVQYSPNGKLLLSSSLDKSARIFSAKSGEEIHSFKGKVELAKTTSFSPDGKAVVLAGKSKVRTYDFLSGEVISRLPVQSKSIISASFAPAEENATPGSGRILTAGMDGIIEIFDRVTGESIKTIKEEKVINHVSFSPDGRQIASACSDKKSRTYQVISGEMRETFEGHGDWVKSAQFSPDGNYLLSSSYDKTARLYNTINGELEGSLEGHTSYIEYAEFNTDGNFMATASWDKTARLWEFPSCKEIRSFSGHSDWVTALNFSPDGKQIATAGRDKVAMIFDVATGKLLHTLSAHTKGITSVKYSPDGKYLLTTAKDFRTIVWDSQTGEELFTRLQLEGDNWLVYDTKYRYDGSEGARDYLYLVCGIELINLSQVKDALYVPGLAKVILSGKEINFPGLDDLDICGLLPLIESQDDMSTAYNYKITPRKKALESIEVYVNEKRVATIPAKKLKKKEDHFLLSLKKEDMQKHFIPGAENEIEVLGIISQLGTEIQSSSETRLEASTTMEDKLSETESEASKDPQEKSADLQAEPRLFALMIGINEYSDTALNLNFPVKDAINLGSALDMSAKKLLGEGNVNLYYLHSKVSKGNGYATPSIKNIQKAFAEIGKIANPQDIILIFFAGHGVLTGVNEGVVELNKQQANKQFFTFLTSDASYKDLSGITTDDLKLWLSYDGPYKMLPNKTILIFDACHSGQATSDLLSLASLDNFSGSTRQVEDLKDKAGVFILAASAPSQVAYEVPSLEQGLLSYCLLHNLKNNPGMLDNETELNVQKWFLETEDFLNQLVKSFGLSQNAQPFGTANIKIARVDEAVRNSITLANQKPMVIAANVLNDLSFDDDLNLKRLINQSLSDLSQRGVNNQVNYPRIETPETNRINIRYEVMQEKYVACDIRLIKKGEVLYRTRISGTTDQLEDLAIDIISKVVPHAK